MESITKMMIAFNIIILIFFIVFFENAGPLMALVSPIVLLFIFVIPIIFGVLLSMGFYLFNHEKLDATQHLVYFPPFINLGFIMVILFLK